MKLKLLSILFFIIASSISLIAKYDVTITSGVFGGTPFWNKENFSEDYAIDPSLKFLRWNNNLSANAYFGDLSLHFSGSRSDGFDIRDDVPESNKYQVYLFGTKYNFSDTRLYRIYGQYKFGGANIRLGRMPTFSRWLFGSVDGGQLSYDITKNLSVSGFGGKAVKYGLFYDDEYDNTVGYGEIAYNMKGFSAKAKYLYSDTASKAGIDLFGCLYGVKLSANVGYDLTNSSLFDGSFGIYGNIGKKLSLSANISRFTPIFIFNNLYFGANLNDSLKNPFVTDRILLGASYKLFDNYTLSFRQMLTLRNENMDYLSYLYISHKYFYIGLNYLSGDSKNERLGISVGGNYCPTKGMRLSAGIASVDYMMDSIDEENINSIASYLQFGWDIIDDLTLNTNLNYYHNNKVFDQKIRGGLTLQYRINSGGSK